MRKGTRARVNGERLLDAKQAGQYIGCSHWKIRDMIATGELAFVKIGRLVKVDRADLDRLIDSSKQQYGSV